MTPAAAIIYYNVYKTFHSEDMCSMYVDQLLFVSFDVVVFTCYVILFSPT